MVSIDMAMNIASQEVPEYPVLKVIDMGANWGVKFDSGDPPVPGIPTITVDKQTGSTGEMTIPPIENIKIILAAPVVWSKDGQSN